MQQQGHIERRVEVLQQAKKEMACKIAELSQLTVVREELEHRLFDLNATLKQLKSRQYELSQQNVHFHCEQLQASKQREQCQEQVKLGRAVGQEIQIDLAQQKDKIQQLLAQKDRILKRKEQLDVKIQQKTEHLEAVKKQIAESQLKVENLKKLQCSRQEIIAKLKNSHEYFAAKAQQIQQKKEDIEKQHEEQIKRGKTLQDTIIQHELHLSAICLRKTDQQRNITNENQKIDGQLLKKKVLLQKLHIMKQRLATVSEQQVYSQHLLEIKEKRARQTQQKLNTRRSAWLEMRDRIAMELQYASYYCQKLEY